jgi:hypothetical protein
MAHVVVVLRLAVDEIAHLAALQFGAAENAAGAVMPGFAME